MDLTRNSARLLRYGYMKLARDFDARFENLLLTGRVSKWYSEVGHVEIGPEIGPRDM